jgi:hypothetical protein
VARRRYLRTVRPAGSIVVEHARYYVGRRLAGQRVTAAVSAADRALVVRHRDTVVKRAPLHGLRLELLPFERYVGLMCQEARSERRRRARPAAAGRVA